MQIDGGCLDITGASSSNGTLIEWWPCNGGANQVRCGGQPGQLVSQHVADERARGRQVEHPPPLPGALAQLGQGLADPGFNTANGTQLILWTCNGGSNQQWSLP